ncbi:hypothetical protein K438DRAFT_1967268 [Mycena galopus ATCC 62051]|nr:hypothetical protein K438DRAFT_1967268 [Mycena galopus ATCC 62051]
MPPALSTTATRTMAVDPARTNQPIRIVYASRQTIPSAQTTYAVMHLSSCDDVNRRRRMSLLMHRVLCQHSVVYYLIPTSTRRCASMPLIDTDSQTSRALSLTPLSLFKCVSSVRSFASDSTRRTATTAIDVHITVFSLNEHRSQHFAHPRQAGVNCRTSTISSAHVYMRNNNTIRYHILVRASLRFTSAITASSPHWNLVPSRTYDFSLSDASKKNTAQDPRVHRIHQQPNASNSVLQETTPSSCATSRRMLTTAHRVVVHETPAQPA